jgi:flagellin
MAVINTNVKALFSQMALKTSGLAQSKAMQQLSTGKRINSARDDAAGMSIATRMTHQIRSLNQAVRNAGDAINLIQTAEGATNEITDMMQRMRELAVQAVNDTNNNADRSYLDLEFQQLKQQIVQISDNTEWNGFPVLNGKAGEQVGEMPVYKVTSENQFGSVFLNPTTARSMSGADAGEKQTFTLTGTPAVGTMTIAGVDVEITSSENTLALASAKIQTTLNNSNLFTSRGMTAAVTGGVATITFNAAEGDVPTSTVLVGSTGLTTTAVTTSRKAATQSVENFSDSGEFLKSGSLQFSVASGAAASSEVTATFTTQDNQIIAMKGTVVTQSPAVIKFAKADGLNSSVISADLTYTLQDSDGAGLDLATRGISMSIGVAGSIPTLRDGDLTINGVNVGPSSASDDLLSPRNNAAGSAIAKAAAINRLAVDQGISQGESQSITFSGTPMPGTITVGGVSVVLTNDDNTPALAASKIAAAMQASPLYDSTTGRKVVYATGSAVINVDFPSKEGNVEKLEVVPGTTGAGSVVNTTQEFATKKPGTGVFAKVNENILTGQSMTAGPVASGVVFINGYASADITTVYNNSQATRANVVRAINLISDRTGVKAIDGGSDAKGVTLVAVDGRNIEVRFEPSASTNAQAFGQRIGMSEGVQSSTISLESKIQAPVVLGSGAAGDITRAGLVAGNYSKNESVLNTQAREPVAASVAQVNSVKLSGTPADTDTVSIVVNGTTFTSTAVASQKPQAISNDLITQINNNSVLGVYATKGAEIGEIVLTARTPGVPFTMTTAKSAGAAVGVAATDVVANQTAQFKSLGMDDLEINGIKIRPTTPADDKFSNIVVSSSDPASSGIALAAAINASTNLTGVTAEANPAVTQGAITSTGTPISGKQSVWVNGIEIQVDFVQNESGTDRRAKVVAAINERTGQHGVTATDNGKGVTLSTDGRNLSVWFDSSKDELSAASFGLDKGGAVAQISKIQVAGAGSSATTEKASVYINGVKVETAALPGSATAVQTAAALVLAINNTASLKNVTAEVNPAGGDTILITSNVPGTAFDLRAPAVATASGQSLILSTVAQNSQGATDVSAVDMSTPYLTNVLGSATAPVSAMNIKTVYSTVRLTADAPVLPALPGADGLPPNMMNITGRPIQIRSGADGFGDLSNFSALGFNEGSFGGRASEDMDPPRVGRMAFQVGSSANQVITIDLADFGKNGAITGQITGDVDLAEEARSVRINTREGATAVLTLLDSSMDKINATRATMGAVMNRLDHVINNLTNVSMNMSASRSSIEDADYASASTELAKTQIMQQAATAVLAQANTSQQSVLKLLGG